MNMKRYFSLFAVTVVFGSVIFLGGTAFAQNGKITAKIVDAKTGEPVFKASIQILETKQGALAKDNGVATIINVAPGNHYTIVSKFAGYEPTTITNVKVSSNLTTNLDIKLSTTIQKEIIVQARPIIDKSKTDNGARFDSSTITNVPGKNSINDLLTLTPGVIADGNNGGVSIAGARGTSNSNRIGGVETTDIVDGQTNSIQANMSKFAVSEFTVTTSGADASRGGATGGFISTNTKSGAANFEFMAHYRQEIPALFGSSSNGYKRMPSGNKIYEFALGGPITEDFKYFITAKGNTIDYTAAGLNVMDPYGNNLGQIEHTKQYGRAVTVNLSLNDVFGFRVSADAILASESRQLAIAGSALSGIFTYGDMTQLPAINNFNNLFTLKGTTQIGEGILEVTGGYETVDERYGKYDQEAGGGLLKPYKIYVPEDKYSYDDVTGTIELGQDGIMDNYTPVSKQIPDPRNPANVLNLPGAGLNPFTGKIEGGSQRFTTTNPYGLLNTFYSVGNPGSYSYDTRRRIQIEAKFSEQISEHLISAGFETQLHNITTFSNDLPWDANPFQDIYDVKPYTAAAYIIDKMEFADITFNPSLRFDLYDPANERALLDFYNPLVETYTPTGDTTITPAFGKSDVQTQLSPRLGITYAISENTTFNFNYGLYFKQPLLNQVLTNTGGDFASVLQRGNQIIGNGNLRAERSTEIVVGFNTALTDVLSMSISGVYKDLRNQSGLLRISSPNLPTGYTLYIDDQYGNAKSLVLTFEKRMRDNYGLRFNYTFSTAKGTSSSAAENYGRLINPPAGEETAALPLQPYPLGYDRTHVGQFIFNLSWQKNEGPEIFGVKLLELFNLSFTTEFRSGLPYTPEDLRGQQAGEFNSARHPSYFQTDASLSRSIQLSDIFGESMGSTAIDLQLEVLNLFNRTEALTVYAQTGQGDDDGQPNVYTGTTVFKNDPTNADGNQLDALGNLKYNARWDLNKDGQVDLSEQQKGFTQYRQDNFARRTNYQVPLRTYFNVTLRF